MSITVVFDSLMGRFAVDILLTIAGEENAGAVEGEACVCDLKTPSFAISKTS
jgi:hypothetical protein